MPMMRASAIMEYKKAVLGKVLVFPIMRRKSAQMETLLKMRLR